LVGSLKKKSKMVGREEKGCAMRGTRFTTIVRERGRGKKEYRKFHCTGKFTGVVYSSFW
jgi:hypothetical protein